MKTVNSLLVSNAEQIIFCKLLLLVVLFRVIYVGHKGGEIIIAGKDYDVIIPNKAMHD